MASWTPRRPSARVENSLFGSRQVAETCSEREAQSPQCGIELWAALHRLLQCRGGLFRQWLATGGVCLMALLLSLTQQFELPLALVPSSSADADGVIGGPEREEHLNQPLQQGNGGLRLPLIAMVSASNWASFGPAMDGRNIWEVVTLEWTNRSNSPSSTGSFPVGKTNGSL
jgi:hypothetical protein